MDPLRCIFTCSWLLVSLTAASEERTGSQSQFAYQDLLEEGRELSPKAAKVLKKKADADPNDIESRIQLLAFYKGKAFRSPNARQAHQQLICWIIKNHPGSPVAGCPEAEINSRRYPNGYAKVKHLWLESVRAHDDNTAVLGNAASFFLHSDQTVAEELLKRAQALEPETADWSSQLGRLYQVNISRAKGKERRELAAKSLAQYERTMEQQKDSILIYFLLHDLAKVAFEANSAEKAEQYANQLLKMSEESDYSWNNGNAVHHGNIVLGRLALQAGDTEKAKLHLVKAGKTRGSPQLNSFGPNMTLAKELLEKGEKEVVLQYFYLCTKFWESEELDEWTAVVKDGGIPDF